MHLQFSLYVLGVILALMFVTGYIFTNIYANTVKRHIVEKLLLKGRSYSDAAGKYVIAASGPDTLKLTNICKSLTANNPNILWAGITNNDGTIIAQTDPDQRAFPVKMYLATAHSSSFFLNERETYYLKSDTIYITFPLIENNVVVGQLSVASSTHPITEARGILIIAIITITLLTILAVIPITMLITHRKFRPIKVISDKLKRIDPDNLSLDIPINSNDEFGYLAETLRVMFSQLRASQRQYIENERFARELEIAHEIQANILPRTYPKSDSFEFYGAYRSAQEVGGDYYDFIDIDEQHLGCLVADVSGKSLSGMLIMLLTRDIVKNVVYTARRPTELLMEVNRKLLPNIKKGMFVTMIFGLLDKKVGRFTFASAGHNPLIWVRGLTGEYKLIKTRGYPLGMTPQQQFDQRIESKQIVLSKNDWLIQYTDGVNEARNSASEEFGMNRFLELVQTHRQLNPKGLVDKILFEHKNFVGSAPQFDDITLLAMKWTGDRVDIETVRQRGCSRAH